jgi:hypothetical protein
MPHSESLAARIRHALAGRRGFSEKKMFGGLGFLLHGNMCVGIWHSSLIVRLGDDQARSARQEPHVADFDITGRPMKGWLMVEPDGLDTDHQLATWINRCLEFVKALPPKYATS